MEADVDVVYVDAVENIVASMFGFKDNIEVSTPSSDIVKFGLIVNDVYLTHVQ